MEQDAVGQHRADCGDDGEKDEQPEVARLLDREGERSGYLVGLRWTEWRRTDVRLGHCAAARLRFHWLKARALSTTTPLMVPCR